MHQPMVNGIEDYLSGRATDKSRGLAQHLESCAECRAEAVAMKDQSELLRALQAPETLDPLPGFYARVMERIEAQAPNSLWSIFLEPVFAKRLVFASLALFVLLGSAVWQTNPDPVLHESNPMSILAGADLPQTNGEDPTHDRAVVLVNLASYGNQPSTLAISSD
jgi:hypothetical protein